MLIDIFHDTACPWCRIGKKYLFDALSQWQGEAVTIRWQPFLLDDTIPSQGIDFRTFMMQRKGVGESQLSQLFSYAKQAGEIAGVKLDFNNIPLAVNTTNSHRLIALTPAEHQNAVVEAVYQAYFEDGLNIGDVETLVNLAQNFGFSDRQLRAQLHGNAALAEVVAQSQAARFQGISSVPFFRFNEQINVSGSQSVAVSLQALQQADSKQLSQNHGYRS
ncbi:DsbA family oxidoreductase [Aliterella atlantica]|uniref:DsbA family oxidoreductase n=1 Tax=Aliterella atlantica TaxID=1827278 RepID=UPI0005D35845|nr:DsbA family oxidoreductase [Aliterella atlantica]